MEDTMALEVSAIYFITLSSLLYAFVWRCPSLWLQFCATKDICAVEALATVAHTLKSIQFFLLFAIFFFKGMAWNLSPLSLSLSLPLLLFGQYLNCKVYATLGYKGVYYGARLNYKVPWVTTFPFTVFKNPQYVGALATLCACFLLNLVSEPVFVSWVVNYFFLITLESSG
jgi:hypothetical protein